ncbi:glycosyl hydrolase 53 family protein [Arenivirga flava]|uniref:Arabinogalactan endo-beta-1,4-galactanase n=1 Tax=Arenivirga flava TaxID=1930060 RepID=A0AA37UKR7_9MICO|nr:glycosyl hydrolase 53 family protein [Arenivirga flava]GMA28302.1 arabinogalactan endo-beta-1,4-galactanase [Arenivirga flava]
MQRKHIAAGALVAALLATGAAAPAAAAPTGPVEAGITVQAVPGLGDDFINGVDVSSVLSLEASGVVFRDAEGRPDDLFAVLAASGVTDVRVRVWNDPYDPEGRGYGAGTVDVARAVTIGERATDAGLNVLVDFHYSDFWADPAKQKAPKAWQSFSVDQKVEAVRDFTTDSLERFREAGVAVTMVQVGNETNNGIAGVTGWADMARIFAAGSEAVQEVLPEARVALHFTDPQTPGRYASIAKELADRGVDYDVFATSYYPFWHGTPENLTAVLGEIASTYGKEVLVAETSWARTLEDGDGAVNVIAGPELVDAYPVSVQGQAMAVRDVIAAVAAVGDAGIGVYYWEPAWLPVGPPEQVEQNRLLWERDGSGWITSAAADYDPFDVENTDNGSGWDNQALFAADGRALESLRVFEYARTGAVSPRAVARVESTTITVTEGQPIELPSTLELLWNDGTREESPVTWSSALEWIDGPGEYTIPGRTAEGSAAAATITVLPFNHLTDGGFEQGGSAWSRTGDALTVGSWNDPRTGARSAHFWAASPFSFSFEQTVTGLEPGRYTATAALQGASSVGDLATIALSDGTTTTQAAFRATGFLGWSTPETDAVEVGEDGSLTVRIAASLPAEAWGTIDDVALVRVGAATPADTAPLAAAVTRAEGVDRDGATEQSLAALDEALAIARVVLAADAPTQDSVDRALAQLETAIDGVEQPEQPGDPEQPGNPGQPGDPGQPEQPAADPTVALSVGTVTAGGRLEVSGTGFQAGELVQVWLHSEPTRIAVLAADASGALRGTVTIPASTEAGQHRIELRGAASGSAWADLTVRAPASAALASTGADVGGVVTIAGLALLLGAGLVTATVVRRKRA